MKRIDIYELDRKITKAARKWRLAETKESKDAALKEYRELCSQLYEN